MGRNRGARRPKDSEARRLFCTRVTTRGARQLSPRARSPVPSTAILRGPRGALTGRHQLQEERLLRAVPLPKLPHYVAFPAGDRHAGGAGPRHSRSPARTARRSRGRRRDRGGASGDSVTSGGGRGGDSPDRTKSFRLGRKPRKRAGKPPPGATPPGPHQKSSPASGLLLLGAAASRMEVAISGAASPTPVGALSRRPPGPGP